MWRMLQAATAQDFVIATGTAVPLREFVREAFAQVGLDWREHVDVDDALRRPSDIAHSRGCPAKAERLLGWKARYGVPDVIRFMIANERGQPWPMVAD
jgi:GDPmannose 4,6-dehydratase